MRVLRMGGNGRYVGISDAESTSGVDPSEGGVLSRRRTQIGKRRIGLSAIERPTYIIITSRRWLYETVGLFNAYRVNYAGR